MHAQAALNETVTINICQSDASTEDHRDDADDDEIHDTQNKNETTHTRFLHYQMHICADRTHIRQHDRNDGAGPFDGKGGN